MNIRWATMGLVTVVAALAAAATSPDESDKVILAIHGGAGAPPPKELTKEQRGDYEAAMKKALRAGHKALTNGSPLDAVEAAIKVMEDSPLFNAGKGAVFTNDGRNELDASIMDGKTKKAGAVAGVTRIKNPIAAARKVMEQTRHVLLIGDGADRFAAGQNLEMVEPAYFWTQKRWDELQKAKEKERKEEQKKKGSGLSHWDPARAYYGTAGAVALKDGNLAAGTSTGGLTNKRHGRVGDSPIIGAGTYADNKTCAVSCTGTGEYFIRFAVAHQIAARMEYQGTKVKDAAEAALAEVAKAGGEGGLIALDKNGKLATPYHIPDGGGTFRGYITEKGKLHLAIYDDWHSDEGR